MCSGAAGFLINSRASVAVYLSVKLLSIGRQKEKSKEIEIVANVGGKYQRGKKSNDSFLIMICCQVLECFCYAIVEGQLFIGQWVECNVVLVRWVS